MEQLFEQTKISHMQQQAFCDISVDYLSLTRNSCRLFYQFSRNQCDTIKHFVIDLCENPVTITSGIL